MSLANLEGEEEFSADLLGEAAEVAHEVMTDRDLVIFKVRCCGELLIASVFVYVF